MGWSFHYLLVFSGKQAITTPYFRRRRRKERTGSPTSVLRELLAHVGRDRSRGGKPLCGELTAVLYLRFETRTPGQAAVGL